MPSKGTLNRLLAAISGQESNGDYNALNSDSGAFGRFQIMPENWGTWAREAGLSSTAPRTPENQDKVAAYKLGQYLDKYGARGAAIAWYAGEGALNYSEYALNRPQGDNGEYPSINQYANEVMGRFGKGGSFSPLVDLGEEWHTDSNNAPLIKEEVHTESEPTFFERFTAPLNEAPLVKQAKVFWLKAKDENPLESYTFTQDDVNRVTKLFPNDIASQEFIYSNANSPAQLDRLIAMQLESKEIERRIDESHPGIFSKGTAATLAGTLAAEALNPLTYIGVGFITKGQVLAGLAKSAVFNATLNTVDAKVRENLTGMKQDIGMAAIIGAGAGVVIPGLSYLASRGASKIIREAAQEELQTAEHLKRKADAILAGKPLGQPKVDKAITFFNKVAAKDYQAVNTGLKSLMDNGSVIVIPRKVLSRVQRYLNQDIPKFTQGFHLGNKTILVKEAIEGMTEKELDGLLLHEIGVHGMSMRAKKTLLNYVEGQIKNPKGLWKQALDKAVAATPKGQKVDMEEVLGYWVQLRGNGKGGQLSKIKNILKKVTGDKSLTDEDVLDAIRSDMKGATREADETLGAKFASDEDVSENHIERVKNTSEVDTQQGIAKPFKSVTKRFEKGDFFGTPFGEMVNSKISLLRDIGTKLVSDARMRALGDTIMTAEDTRNYCIGQFNMYLKPLMQKHRNYRLKKYGSKAFNPHNEEEVNKLIMLYHDSKYAGHTLPEGITIAEEIKEMAELLNQLEAKQIELAKHFGYIDDPAWANLDKGTRRVFNREKWLDFATSYKGEKGAENALKDLEDYFFEAANVKRDANKALLEKMRQRTYQKEVEEYTKKVAEWEKKGKVGEEPVKPVLKEVTEEDVDKFIRDEAHGAAYGYLDQDTSNFKGNEEGSSKATLPWMNHRIHMDTSYTKVMNGIEFSFDNNLRSYDLGLILNRTTNRWAGEIALHKVFQGKFTFDNFISGSQQLTKDINTYRAAIKKQGEQLVQTGAIKVDELYKSLQVFDDTIRDMRGMANPDNNTWFGYVGDILRNETYARVSGNMGLNQKMDFAGSVGYIGLRALTSIIPWVGKFIQKKVYGKDFLEAAEASTAKLMGEDVKALVAARQNLLNSRRGAYITGGSVLDKLNNFVNVNVEIANAINGLPQLTNRMIRDARLFTYMDILSYINGKKGFGLFNSRVPFSDIKLNAAGIKNGEEWVENLKGFLKDGQLDFDRMFKENPTLHAQCWKFINNQAQRAVVESSIGNKNILASRNTFAKIFFQFKNFSFYATNSQTMRKLTHKERDDLLSTVYDLMFSAGVLYAGIQGKAWAEYSKDEYKRKEFIDKRMKDYAYGVLTRSSTIGSPLAMLIDGLEVAGRQNFRTTTASKRYTGNELKDTVGRIVAQSPAVDTLTLITQNGLNYHNRGFTKKNIKDTFGILVPGNNQHAVNFAINEMLSGLDIPDK